MPTVEQIAQVCHEANRAWCQANGDTSQATWAFAAGWQKESAVAGVTKLLEEDLSSAALHYEWCDFKRKDGWVYGETKDEFQKTHPCLVPYESLPPEQQAKDALFMAIVKALR